MANGRTIQINIVPCLLGKGNHNRKEWLENRLEELPQAARLNRHAFLRGKGLDLGGSGRFSERLPCGAQSRQIPFEKLRGDWLLRRLVATSRAKWPEIGERLGLRRLVNLRGCLIR
jgi:hypothetical protein